MGGSWYRRGERRAWVYSSSPDVGYEEKTLDVDSEQSGVRGGRRRKRGKAKVVREDEQQRKRPRRTTYDIVTDDSNQTCGCLLLIVIVLFCLWLEGVHIKNSANSYIDAVYRGMQTHGPTLQAKATKNAQDLDEYMKQIYATAAHTGEDPSELVKRHLPTLFPTG